MRSSVYHPPRNFLFFAYYLTLTPFFTHPDEAMDKLRRLGVAIDIITDNEGRNKEEEEEAKVKNPLKAMRAAVMGRMRDEEKKKNNEEEEKGNNGRATGSGEGKNTTNESEW